MELQSVYPLDNVVKVDNNVEGVKDGVSATYWTISVAKSRYHVDTEEEIRENKELLVKSKSHYVVNNIIDIPKSLDDINSRIEFGECSYDTDCTYMLFDNRFVESDEYFRTERRYTTEICFYYNYSYVKSIVTVAFYIDNSYHNICNGWKRE